MDALKSLPQEKTEPSAEFVKINDDHYYVRSHAEFDGVCAKVGAYYAQQTFNYRFNMDNEGPKYPTIVKINRSWSDIARRWDIEFTFGDPELYAKRLCNELKTLIELNPVIGVVVYETLFLGK